MFFIWLFLDIENIKCSFFRPFCFLRTAQVFFIPKICLFEYTFGANKRFENSLPVLIYRKMVLQEYFVFSIFEKECSENSWCSQNRQMTKMRTNKNRSQSKISCYCNEASFIVLLRQTDLRKGSSAYLPHWDFPWRWSFWPDW